MTVNTYNKLSDAFSAAALASLRAFSTDFMDKADTMTQEEAEEYWSKKSCEILQEELAKRGISIKDTDDLLAPAAAAFEEAISALEEEKNSEAFGGGHKHWI